MKIVAITLALVLISSAPAAAAAARYQCNKEETHEHPNHCHLMDMAATQPQQLANELHAWAKDIGFVIPSVDNSGVTAMKRNLRLGGATSSDSESDSVGSLPTVMAHGMGDSCFNGGMQSITNRVATITGQYATCIPTGDNLHDDTLNGYFMSMDANIDAFAEKVQADATLSKGFHAMGLSQGNNVIRGYIAKYNDPPVHTFISINGVNAGIGAVPYCIPKYDEVIDMNTKEEQPRAVKGKICDALMEIASHKAYSEFSQTHSFQANYWRDPRPTEKENYQKYSQLAQIGNEGLKHDLTLNDNFAKTQKFVWVLATQDNMIWPREGEQWGAPNPDAADPFNDVLPMKETEWYESDSFGLKSADVAGKHHFEQFDGDHLQFSMDDFDSWVQTYLVV